MSEKMKTIAVRKNENGEVLEVLEIKTVLETRCKELQHQANSNCARYDAEKQVEKNNEKVAKDYIVKSLKKHNLFIAKALFNDFVDKGLMETNEQFEEMFANFVKGVAPYNEELEPKDFKKVFEGVID